MGPPKPSRDRAASDLIKVATTARHGAELIRRQRRMKGAGNE